MRVKFIPGQQTAFLKYIIQNKKTNLRRVSTLVRVDYELMKKYNQEKCFMPEEAFRKLCRAVHIKPESLDVEFIQDNWGQVKGGKLGIKTLREKYQDKMKEWSAKGGRGKIYI